MLTIMHHRWRYPNLTLTLLSMVTAILLIQWGALGALAERLGSLGYLGVFILGVFFVSTFTVAPAGAGLFVLAGTLNPFAVALLGALGAAIGDYLALIFIRERLLAELNPILKALHLFRFRHFFHSRYFAWLIPLVGALVIATPLPDELGLSLMGISKIKPARFMAIAFGLHFAAMLIIALVANR